MPRIEKQVVVLRPPEEVFAALVDPARRAKWLTTMDERAPEGTLRVGSRVEARRRASATGSRYQFTVIALDPPRRLAMDVARNGAHVARNAFELEPASEGTRVRSVAEFELTGLQKMMTPVVSATMERDLETELASFKRHVESA